MSIRIHRWKLLCLALGAPVAMLALAWWLLPKPPLLDGVDFSQRVFDRHGNLLRVTLTGDEKYRIRTPLAEIAPDLVKATLLQEDRFYRRHPGINPVAIGRSAWSLIRTGKAHAGASTITMQLARMRFQIRSRTLTGKLVQIFRALELERHYTKSQILEAYFNLAPYGRNIEGIGAASTLYFGKPPSRLTLPQAVTLSVIPQSPTRRALHRDRDNPSLDAAQKRLFQRIAPGFGGASFRARATGSYRQLAPHFTRRVLSENTARQEIVTTLDLDFQRLLERRLRSYIETNRQRGIANGAAMLVDGNTLEILAQVGSADFFDSRISGQIDGTRCGRSPGSTLKPFVYALALDQGLIHPLSILVDAPHSFGDYNPENFDREFAGPIRATDALSRSRNIPAIDLASRLSHPRLYEFLKTAGVKLPHEEGFYGLTLPLGGAEVTMQDLIRLYGALANGGTLRALENTLPHRHPSGGRILSPEATFLTLEMLGTNARPFEGGGDAGCPVFWKTGTSNGFHDAWSVAVFSHYILAVWFGNFDGRSNPALVGRTFAGPLLFQIIDALRADGRAPSEPHLPPAGANLRRVELCAVSGQIPTSNCKDRVNGWFIPGVSPIATCTVHRKILVDAATGLRVAHDDGSRPLREAVYEFWPSDLLELFAKAGLPRRSPPPFLPGHEAEPLSALPGKRKAFRIVSPKAGVVYAIRAEDEKTRNLTLKADAEADVARIYWFAGKEFLGAANRHESVRWQLHAGEYTITALDDHGRSDSVSVTVQSADGL